MVSPTVIPRKPLPNVAKHVGYDTVLLEPPGSDESPATAISNEQVHRMKGTRAVILAAIVFGCSILILAAVGYLTFLWVGGPTRTGWKLIVLANWAATSVAICAVVVRWASGLQMVLCTSILALNMLKKGTAIHKIPRMSTLRYNNSGPLDFALLLPWRRGHGIHPHLFFIIALSMATTIALQFSSTLLLSDLAPGPIRSFGSGLNNPILRRDLYLPFDHFYMDVLSSTAPSYPLFAEYSESSQHQSEAIDDTGPSLRAILPVSAEQNRSDLLSFEGDAAVYDARWICMPPELGDLTLIGTPPANLYLSGTANNSVYTTPLVSWIVNETTPFNCSLATTDGGQGWNLMTCHLGTLGLMNSLDTVFNDSAIYNSKPDHWQYGPADSDQYDNMFGDTPIGDSYLVINATVLNVTMAATGIGSGERLTLNFNETESWSTTPNGYWTHLTSSQLGLVANGYGYGTNETYALPMSRRADWVLGLDISLCSNAFPNTKTVYIMADRNETAQEPVSLTSGIRQIGATENRLSLGERGIMELNKTQLDQKLFEEREEIVQNHGQGPILPWSLIFSYENPGAFQKLKQFEDRWWYPSTLSEGNELYDVTFLGVTEDHAALFQEVIQSTSSPALTMQSIQHTFISDRYYKYMPYYENVTHQTVSQSINAVYPVRQVGFITVMTAIVLHFALVIYILIFFGVLQGAKRTVRLIDQAWQVFGQVNDVQNHIMEATHVEGQDKLLSSTATDDEVEDKLKLCGLKNKIYVLDDDGFEGAQFKHKKSN